jgi:copper homeostasis protein
MTHIGVEICVEATTAADLQRSVRAAEAGGAERIELCAEMRSAGLTPQPECVRAARAAFGKPGLMVMIRPRGGDFEFRPNEIALMEQQILVAADCGSDGVVLGVLGPDGELAQDELKRLIGLAQARGLTVTFHRAFDALADRLAAIPLLAGLGVHRVLTAGIAWGQQGTAVEGLDVLQQLSAAAPAGLELVIGGGVSAENAPRLLQALSACRGRISLHAFSAALEGDCVSARKVRAIVDAASGVQQ